MTIHRPLLAPIFISMIGRRCAPFLQCRAAIPSFRESIPARSVWESASRLTPNRRSRLIPPDITQPAADIELAHRPSGSPLDAETGKFLRRFTLMPATAVGWQRRGQAWAGTPLRTETRLLYALSAIGAGAAPEHWRREITTLPLRARCNASGSQALAPRPQTSRGAARKQE